VPLVTSLLTAIVRADGDALVLHAGERPYVVAPAGQVELASRALTLDAVKGMLNELLSADARRSLDEIGAVQHDLGSPAFAPGQRFSVVAARGGDDIWIEIRRQRPVEQVQPPADAGSDAIQPAPAAPEPAPTAQPEPVPEPVPETVPEPRYVAIEANLEAASHAEAEIWSQHANLKPAPITEPAVQPEAILEPERTVEPEPKVPDVARPAVVLPLARQQVRGDQGGRFTPALHATGIDRLLRIAAARGASTLYLTSQARPAIRVDGEISAIEGENTLSEADVEALIIDMIPERNREALRSQAGTEWICDVPDVGRIRCVTFRDHRGAGGIFRMIPARAISAEQLGLSREIQGLCAESDGLVLVAGGRSSGKSTLISAFVDLINRTRSDHVITIENQIKFVHENRGSLVSQREVRGDRSELVAAARAALRENPDVLVVEDFGSPEMVTLALEAAQSGHLVIGALTAHTATDAVDRIIDQTPPDRRAKVQMGLAESLRGIVAQVLLRKAGGGRVAAREVLLNTSAVANLIAEGKTSQLPMAIDSGRKHGMVALNDALVAFVQSGIVDSREVYRHAADQQGLLALLKRQGIDTSFVERLA
jgi:twitching motility protein PilT